MLINLYSDTQTRPVAAMRAAMAAAGELAGLPGITLDPDTVETNIVVFRLAGAPRFCARLEAEHGVRMGTLGADLVRAVTHHDVDTTGVHRAVDAAAAVLSAELE